MAIEGQQAEQVLKLQSDLYTQIEQQGDLIRAQSQQIQAYESVMTPEQIQQARGDEPAPAPVSVEGEKAEPTPTPATEEPATEKPATRRPSRSARKKS